MNAECANDGLSQPRGSTNEELHCANSSLSQERGSPHTRVSTLGPRPLSRLSPTLLHAPAAPDPILTGFFDACL
jgi:hypothetical protein